MDNSKSLKEIDQDEQLHLRKVRSLLWENRALLSTTKQALQHGAGLLVASYVLCKVTRMRQSIGLVLSSVTVGGLVHGYLAFCKDVNQLCRSDTQLGNSLRLHYQHISINNLCMPYFGEKTKKASATRNSSNSTSQ